MRCFVGICLPERTRHLLARAAQAVRSADARWEGEKWVPQENLHVTLHFLGDVSQRDLALLDSMMAQRLASIAAFELELAAVRAVPSLGRCRMLWAAFSDPGGRCAQLAGAVQTVAMEFGVEADDRQFKPHATLCRARRPKPVSGEALASAEALVGGVRETVSVGTASLYSSRLTPHGAVYSLVGEWQLRGA